MGGFVSTTSSDYRAPRRCCGCHCHGCHPSPVLPLPGEPWHVPSTYPLEYTPIWLVPPDPYYVPPDWRWPGSITITTTDKVAVGDVPPRASTTVTAADLWKHL